MEDQVTVHVKDLAEYAKLTQMEEELAAALDTVTVAAKIARLQLCKSSPLVLCHGVLIDMIAEGVRSCIMRREALVITAAKGN